MSLAELQKSNKERHDALVNQGAMIHPLLLMQLQIDLLIEALPKTRRDQYLLAMERGIERLIENGELELVRARLTIDNTLGTNLSLADINRDKPLGG